MYSLDKETVRFKCRNSQYNSIFNTCYWEFNFEWFFWLRI